MSGDLNKPYNPGIAELGKFIEVTSPSVSSFGHYAILTVNAGNLPVSAGGQVQENLTVNILSSSYPANNLFTYSSSIKEVDIQNYTGGRVYYLPNVQSDVATVTAGGIIIEDTGYFSVKRPTSGFSIANVLSGDVKMIIYS